MKRINSFLFFIAVFCASVAAQPVKKTEKINEEEVPAAIRVAFMNDFGQIPEDGVWTVNFIVVSDGTKTLAKPTGYTYRKGNKQEKIEVRYSPEGKLELAKGLNKIEHTGNT